MTSLKGWITALILYCASPVLAQDLPVVRLVVLQIGTVNWELETITAHGFDEKHGFRLEMQP
jgi:NitT/TauT family transport system substrate-binding protein